MTLLCTMTVLIHTHGMSSSSVKSPRDVPTLEDNGAGLHAVVGVDGQEGGVDVDGRRLLH